MTLNQRFARLALLAALAAPALAFAPYAIHAFATPESVTLVPLAALAALLAWNQDGDEGLQLPWPWWLGLALLALLWWLHGRPDSVGRVALWLRLVEPRWVDALPRAALALAGLACLRFAWTQRSPHPQLGRLPLLGLALALWAILAGALSLRPDLACATLAGQAAYILVFFAAFRAGRDPGAVSRVAWLLLWVGLVNAAYGLLQVARLDPMRWNDTFGGRASGFFGNPDLLGGQLALLLPLALAMALAPIRPGAWAWPRWVVVAGLALGLLATQTRGAWAGAAAGLALVLVWTRKAGTLLPAHRRALGILSLALLAAGGLWAWQDPRLLPRLAATLTGQDVEAGRRAYLMRKTGQLALRHPWLGVGPGNFRIYFPSVETVGIAPQAYAQQPYVVSEHGHNDLLQWAADAGWPASLLWAALLVATFTALSRRRVDPASTSSAVLVGAAGALAATTVHGLANYPFLLLPTQASLWGLLGAVLARPRPAPLEAGVPPAWPLRLRRSATLFGFVLLTAAALVWQGRRLAEDHFWWVGDGQHKLARDQQSATMVLRTLALDRQEDRLWKLHGEAENAQGHIWDSIGSFREAVRLNPYDGEAAVRLGRACVENRLYDEAESTLFKVSQYAPNLVDLWEPLAAAYFNQQKFEQAIQAYDWMLYFHINDESAYANKAAALGNLGRLPEALKTLLDAEQALPQSGKVQVNLAITYLKMGLRRQAKASWARANQLSPSDPQVDQLRKVLR